MTGGGASCVIVLGRWYDSDVDLVLDPGDWIDTDTITWLPGALSEYDLIIKVDIVDLHAIDPGFRAPIQDGMVELPRG